MATQQQTFDLDIDDESDNDLDQCPNCDGNYKSLGSHWSRSKDCSYPDLTDKQDQIVKGLMLGDGGLLREQKNASMNISSTNKQFLEWVDYHIGIICTGNYSCVSEDDHLRYADEHDRDVENAHYNDTWTIRLRSHPHFNQYRDWYGEKNGRQVVKNIPDIEIGPITAKVWYCSDGHMSFDEHAGGHCMMTSENCAPHNERLIQSFTGGDFGVHLEKHGVEDGRIIFNRSGTRQFLDWIGEPVDGFEYKWCSEDRSEYERLKS